jgi:hypothetical protein
MLDNISKLSKLYAIASDQRLQQLSEIKSFAKRIAFATSNWPRLASGSARVIFDYAPGLILKVAKNDKGIAQNMVERDYLIQSSYKDIIATIKEEDTENKWIIVERAQKVTPSQFRSLAGFDIKELDTYLRNWSGKMRGKRPIFSQDESIKQKIEESPLIQEVLDMVGNFDMPTADFGRISSWGRIDDRLVLTDYGLTHSVYEEHYKR